MLPSALRVREPTARSWSMSPSKENAGAAQTPTERFMATAVEAVRLAGQIHLDHLRGGLCITRKENTDIVTDVDIEVEAIVRELIRQRFPGHNVLAEEMADDVPAAADVPYRWLFDPLDGTVNYAHGLAFFSASLALEMAGVVEVAAVYDPSRSELFNAIRGQGAFRNGQRIAVSRTSRIGDAVLGTGFPHGATSRDRAMERLLGECAIRARGLRRLGSAALDLCYVACGRMDGFWDKNLKPWDTAAGALIVAEAGGAVTAIDGGTFDPYAGHLLATNGRLHQDILDIIRAQ
jgi:myo-inositol-1(or 4)-monophosphatase